MIDRIEASLLAVVRTSDEYTLSPHEVERLKAELQRISDRGGVLICPPGVTVYRKVDGQWEPLPDRGPEFGAHAVAGKIQGFCCKTFESPILGPAEHRDPSSDHWWT